ncbi:CNP1-like family protein [Thiohalocapsa sp. ML1]|jgi:hypothetical protein|uniref:CNP1-like family protein n=1 Tax=Thiohalocapsa sp. ML1 TaxID=1431688 RepID=UPI0007322CC6|nr:CNP1-like family protein [Thiohalocapsa sp. ML1]
MPLAPPTVRKAHPLPLTALVLLALCAAPTAAGPHPDTPFVNDAAPDAPKSVRPGRAWEEADYRLPAWPRDADLIEVKLDGPQQPLTHYIDARSLQTGSDGVVRYTLVTETASGARSVGFEGLRCTPKGRWKLHAVGSDGRFTPPRMGDDWQEISATAPDPLHDELWRHYLCIPRAFSARATRDQLRMLKSGRVPRVENAGFLSD